MTKYSKLDAVKFGLAGGIVTAICVVLTTLASVIKPEYVVMSVDLIKDIYGFLGYDTSLVGALLGAVYSFINGFILTWVFAIVYNKLIK